MEPEEKKRQLMSDINVTPLVDVMLVLLIIFMATAPMMRQGVKVNLPETESKSIKSKDEPLVLSITKERQIYIENFKIEISNLNEKLEKIFSNRKEKEILLESDKDVPYGFVIKVMSHVKAAGITRVGMITEPLRK
ncbi:MAG: protein TolR [Deltaproteobacteria bacterium]|nr:protein TolR [Deltaproteobacteria bacterium]